MIIRICSIYYKSVGRLALQHLTKTRQEPVHTNIIKSRECVRNFGNWAADALNAVCLNRIIWLLEML